MEYCKKFVNDPKTIELLKKKYRPFSKKFVKLIKTKKMTKKMENQLIESGENSFARDFGVTFCNNICNQPSIACGTGKRYKKLWLSSIKNVDLQKILQENGVKF